MVINGSHLSKPSGRSLAFLDDRYVNVDGDTMTGDLALEDGVKLFIGTDSWFIKNGQTVELWVNSVLHEAWEEDAPAIAAGTAMGPIGMVYA